MVLDGLRFVLELLDWSVSSLFWSSSTSLTPVCLHLGLCRETGVRVFRQVSGGQRDVVVVREVLWW